MKFSINGRRCGKTMAMKAAISAAVKAGEKVFMGMDYANGKDRTVELRFMRLSTGMNVMV